jgi:hypothetical protein
MNAIVGHRSALNVPAPVGTSYFHQRSGSYALNQGPALLSFKHSLT